MSNTALTPAEVHEHIVALGVQSAFYQATTRRSALFDRIRKVRGSGKGVEATLQTEDNESVTSGFTIGGALPAPDAAKGKQMLIPWGNYTGSFSIADRQLKESMSAGDRSRMINDVIEQIDHLSAKLAGSISTDMISGSTESVTAGTIVGLTGGQIEDTGSLGGLSRSTYTSLACYVGDNSGTPEAVTDALIEEVLDYYFDTIEGNPLSVAFCGYALWNDIRELSGAVTETKNDRTGNGVGVWRGATDLFFRDIPIVKIPGYTTGRLDFVNEDALSLEYLPAGGMDSQGAAREMFDIKLPRREGDSWVFDVFAYAQMRLANPRKNACSLQDMNS